VRVDIERCRDLPLPALPADLTHRDALAVPERDALVAEIVRMEVLDPGGLAGGSRRLVGRLNRMADFTQPREERAIRGAVFRRHVSSRISINHSEICKPARLAPTVSARYRVAAGEDPRTLDVYILQVNATCSPICRTRSAT
jgi:hypothetical protein